MSDINRRAFLKWAGSGAAAAALPASIREALAVPAHHRTGTIEDVEHIVVITQENRSFDQYFGTLRGVRGFGDPRAARLPSGKSVWEQPGPQGDVLPFRPQPSAGTGDSVGMTFVQDVAHGWNDSHAAWNLGRYDQWVPAKGAAGMMYVTRHDIPFHFALADAFTVCDAYHASLMGPTDPNRYHMWTGWVGNDGKNGGPVISNAEAGYDWSTYPERLTRAGISWKVYQDVGVGLDAAGSWGWTGDPYIGNYGDNSLLYFHQYQNARPGTPLADAAKTGTNILANGKNPAGLFDQLRADVRARALPQVSYVASPEVFSEHPNWPINYGAWYIAQILEILMSDPDLWSRTAVIINYDEAGGFFDHVVPPTPPMDERTGRSTVSTVDEILQAYPNNPNVGPTTPLQPYGLGTRVPMLVVSPWSRGGWVNSEVFDHTSVIRFLERRFATGRPDLVESNITPWRRAVVGDLTSCFDFRRPNVANVHLPATAAYEPPLADVQATRTYPDVVPVPPIPGKLPKQERGVRLARPLPYRINAAGTLAGGQAAFRIGFVNTGRATAAFQVRSGHPDELPRNYTVEPGKQLADTFPANLPGAGYDLSVYGPNGFFRAYRGGAGAGRAQVELRVSHEGEGDIDERGDDRRDDDGGRLAVLLKNHGARPADVSLRDAYTGQVKVVRLGAGERTQRTVDLQAQFGWYDLTATVAGDAGFLAQAAGHVETGRPSTSDPLLGR